MKKIELERHRQHGQHAGRPKGRNRCGSRAGAAYFEGFERGQAGFPEREDQPKLGRDVPAFRLGVRRLGAVLRKGRRDV